jgi:hypothetical protein
MAPGRIIAGMRKETLNKSFDKALLSEVEGLRTNGK